MTQFHDKVNIINLAIKAQQNRLNMCNTTHKKPSNLTVSSLNSLSIEPYENIQVHIKIWTRQLKIDTKRLGDKLLLE